MKLNEAYIAISSILSGFSEVFHVSELVVISRMLWLCDCQINNILLINIRIRTLRQERVTLFTQFTILP